MEKSGDTSKGKPNPMIVVVIAILIAVGIAICSSFIGSSGPPSLVDCDHNEDPIQVMECLDQFCKFDSRQCQINCPLGFQSDDTGCPISCECASSGLREFDVQFLDDEVPQLLQDYTETTDEVMVTPSRSPESRSPAFALFFGSATSNKEKLWLTHRDQSDNRIKIPYKIDPKMPPAHETAIKTAISEFKQKTCIDFVPYEKGNKEHHLWHLNFVNERGCWSYVGKKKPNGQSVGLGNGCQVVGIVEHEVMHALGFNHEQSRPDRDSYVTVNMNAIKDGKSVNFKKMAAEKVVDLKSVYDIGSLLHYRGTSFAKNPSVPTITVKKTGQAVQAQRVTFSEEDLKEINALYECNPKSAQSEWSNWQPWSSPDKTCGTARVYRFRKCETNGQPASGCKGEASETKNEIQAECLNEDLPKSWGPWKKWSQCNKKCGSGHTIRIRLCGGVKYGRGCPTSKKNTYYELKFCNTDPCDSDTAKWSTWSSWAQCSESCKQGFTYIEATCFNEKKEISLNCPGGDSAGKRYRLRNCNVGMTSCHQSSKPPAQAQTQPQQQLYQRERSFFGASGYMSSDESNTKAQNGVGDFLIPDSEYESMCGSGDGHYTFGDFNGDGVDDVLCSVTPTTFVQYFILNGRPVSQWKGEIKQCSDPHQRFVKDFNGDGMMDVVCHDSVNGRPFVKYVNKFGELDNTSPTPIDLNCKYGRLMLVNFGNKMDAICQKVDHTALFLKRN